MTAKYTDILGLGKAIEALCTMVVFLTIAALVTSPLWLLAATCAACQN